MRFFYFFKSKYSSQNHVLTLTEHIIYIKRAISPKHLFLSCYDVFFAFLLFCKTEFSLFAVPEVGIGIDFPTAKSRDVAMFNYI